MIAIMMPEKVNAAIIPPSHGQMLLNIFNEFVAVTGNNKLSAFKGVVFKNRFSYATTVVMVNGIYSIIENNEWTFNALCLRQQDCEAKAAHMPLAKEHAAHLPDVQVHSEMKFLSFLRLEHIHLSMPPRPNILKKVSK
ncbi:hypothetical protein [Yersinia intermedia]|nr:hypothetical protein [Yersinia intermedia]MDN0114575.1 hypothetical protein [Yersinia intermedia]